MLVKIMSNTDLILDNITNPEEETVAERFSVTVDNYRFVDTSQAGGWNGVYRRYDRGRRRLARPFLGELIALCNKESIPLAIKDYREPWDHKTEDPENIGADYLPGISLDDYQIQAIRKAMKTEVGIYNIPTGGGKTEVMAGIVKGIPVPTVIIAEQRVIIEQIKQRLELRDVVDEVGLFYAGSTPDGQTVIVGSIQSLIIPSKIPQQPQMTDMIAKATLKLLGDPEAPEGDPAGEPSGEIEGMDEELIKELIHKNADKLYQKALAKHASALKGYRKRKARAKQFQELVKAAEMVIVDECDLATSSPYKQLFKNLFTGRRRYGFSGTPYDPAKPLEALFLQEHLGSVIYEVDRQTVEDLGRIVPVDYYMFAVDGNPREGSAFDIAVKEKMVECPAFHALVKMIVEGFPDEGTLVLVERDGLGHALEKCIEGSVFIHGVTSKRRRNEVLAEFERREIRVVIGGKILRRGLDLKGGCENLVIGTGGKLWSTFNQQVGRAVRRNRRGRSRVIDFLFLNNKYLYNHSRQRLKAIVDMGYKVKVVFPDGQTVEGGQFIASRFRRPPPKRG